jgi:hypothetical protein
MACFLPDTFTFSEVSSAGKIAFCNISGPTLFQFGYFVTSWNLPPQKGATDFPSERPALLLGTSEFEHDVLVEIDVFEEFSALW